MHFDLDSHDAYATTDDDPARMVPNPVKKKAHRQVLAARARYDRALAATDAALLEAVSPPTGQSVLITNTCLLYTSDAADDLTRVDLGGRRSIKKKKKK